MFKTILSWFKPARYRIKFDYIYYGQRYMGQTAWYDSKGAVNRQAEMLNRVYGAGTHKVERGNKLG